MRKALLLAMGLLPAIAAAQAPAKLGFQGRLLKSDGMPEAGVVQVEFAIFAAPSGGSSLWQEQQTVGLADGYYSLLLGEQAAIPADLFDGSVRYLEMKVGGSALTPRQVFASVPYAMLAATVKGGVVDATEVRVNGVVVIDSAGKLKTSVPFAGLSDVPAGLADGDDDALAKISCPAGQVLKHDGAKWGCGSAAEASHQHAAADLASGTLAVARLPVGTAAGTVAAGDHGHGFDAIAGDLPLARTTGDLPLARTTGDLPFTRVSGSLGLDRTTGDLPISRTTGAIPFDRLPVGTGANQVKPGNAPDADTLGSLSCSNGQTPKYNQSKTAWECASGGGGGALVGSWEFDETNGTSFADASGGGNTLVAPYGGQSAGSGGHTGAAIAFSGGVVQAGTGNSIPDSPYVTVEAWVRPTSTLVGNQTLLHKDGAYKLVQENGKPAFSITSKHAVGGVSTCKVTHTTAATIGAWSHVVGYYNGREIAVAIDGFAATQACQLGPIKGTLGNPFYVGAEGTARSEPYDGRIDEVRLWGVAPVQTVAATLGSKDNPGRTCKDILTRNRHAPDGIYWIDPDGTGAIKPVRVVCDMRRDGGGWTLGLKTWYQAQGIFGVTGHVGTVEDGLQRRGSAYKLDDAAIRAIIGSSNNFDVLADQAGHNSGYSYSNREYVILRNYTGTWTFGGVVSESSTATTMQSYISQTEEVIWTGRLSCGVGGWGINCYNVVSGSNPQGGAGCSMALGTQSSSSWHNFYMAESNSDSYLYICNGAQHSSGYDLNHRFWFRERN